MPKSAIDLEVNGDPVFQKANAGEDWPEGYLFNHCDFYVKASRFIAHRASMPFMVPAKVLDSSRQFPPYPHGRTRRAIRQQKNNP